MDGIGKCLAGAALATFAVCAFAGQPKKDPNDGMVYVQDLGWVYPDAHCVGREVYVHGHPTGSRMYIGTDAVLHDCERPGDVYIPMGPTKPSRLPAVPRRDS